MAAVSKPSTSRFSLLNSKYSALLKSDPLKTKAATLVFFALFNEQLASLFAGDIQYSHIPIPFTNKSVEIPHTLTHKVPLMGIFACLINTPITHFGYNLIHKIIPAPLTPKKKFLQILLSTGIITPIFCASFVCWIAFINNLSRFKNVEGKNILKKLQNYSRILTSISIKALKASFLKVFSTSAITSPIFMSFAQRFVAPEAWAVFFAFCYFIVGTYNNTKVKSAQMKLKKQTEEDSQDSSLSKKLNNVEHKFNSESETEVDDFPNKV